MPKLDFSFANFLCVGNQASAIKRRHGTRHHKLMRNAAGCKLATPKVAQFKRAIDQLVVVCRQVLTKALLVNLNGLQAGGD